MIFGCISTYLVHIPSEFAKMRASIWMEGRAPSLFVITKVSSTAAAIGWTVPCGPMENSHSPCSMEFDAILLHFLHNTEVNMLCRLFEDRKYMYIYLHIHQEYGHLRKQNICLHFPTSICKHLWPSPCKFIAIPCSQLRMRIVILSKKLTRLKIASTTSKHHTVTLNVHRFKLRKHS